MRFVVVGAGAIGGTVGARLVRDGHDVLFCDAAADHVAAMNEHGLAIEGPVEELTVPAPAVQPDGLPDRLDHVLLAVKSQHTETALAAIAPRLAPDGYVVSLQNGLNEPVIAAAVGEERTIGAFVNFGADYLGPGRILLANRATFVIGELDGRRSERVATLVAAVEDARETDNVLGYLWGKMAYGAMLFGTAVSDLSIADALDEPAYRPLFTRLAQEALEAATATPEAFDGFDPSRPRRLARAPRRVQPQLRQDALGHLQGPGGAPAPDGGRDARPDRPPARAPHGRAHPRHRGRPPCLRAGQPGAAGGLRAPRGVGAEAERRDGGRRRARPGRLRRAPRLPGRGQGQHGRGRLRDDERLDGRHAAAGHPRRRGGRTAARGRRRRHLQDEPARVRSGEREPGVRDDVQPAGSRPHLGRVEQRIGGARGCGRLRVRARAATPAARSASRLPTAGSSG